MTLDEVITLIQTWIIENGNEEITADVLRPILVSMVQQPNDLIGDLDDLTTTYQDDLVGAINEINSLLDTSGLVIYTGSDLPDDHSFPTVLTPADFYVQFDGSTVLGMWTYNGNEWVAQVPQRTRTALKFVSLVGVTIGNKKQVEWMAEAINLNISNGAVYECEPGDIIDFYVNLIDSVGSGSQIISRVFTRLLTGATSVTSVTANDLMPDGSEEIIIDSELIVELGDIGSDDVWTAFNADPDQPFDMTDEMFVSAVQDSEPKLWQWIGGAGSFGSTGTPATEDDFLDLTLQPEVISYENNIISIKTVLDDDLDTVDAEGLATYYNALTPSVLKQGYESWRINIVDEFDAVLKTFDLVNRGKGLIGSTSDLPELEASNFFEINVDGGTQNLQQVTDEGNETTNAVIFKNSDPFSTELITIASTGISYKNIDGHTSSFRNALGTSDNIIDLPDSSGQLVTDVEVDGTAYARKDREWVEIPGGIIFSNPYANTAAMIADQANQDEQTILVVTDASDDSNITFPISETRLQAYYQYKGTTNGNMTDYRLVSAPYAGGSISPNILFATDYGTSDADISLGSTSFGTDSLTGLQEMLDEALTRPILIYWDGKFSVSGALEVHSNTTIIALAGCGVILRNASNSYLLKNKNTVDPSATGGWNSNIVDENIIIENLILNGNGYNTGPGGSDIFDVANNGSPVNGSAQTKRNQIIDFTGVKNFHLKNVQLLGGRYWAAHFANVKDSFIEDILIDFGASSDRDSANYDGLHFKGGSDNIKIKNVICRNTKDDNIAFNAYSQLVIYTDQRGPITNIQVDGVHLESKTMGIGIYSETSLSTVDNIWIKNVTGTTQSHWMRITNGEDGTDDGVGFIGSIIVENVNVDVLNGSTLQDFDGLINIRANIEKLILRNIVRSDFEKNNAYICLSQSDSEIRELIIDGVQMETTGGTWNKPFLKVDAGKIYRCIIDNYIHNEITSYIDSPVVEVNGGEFRKLILSNINCTNVNSVLKHTGGILQGIVANNIGNFDSPEYGFGTTTEVDRIFLSNYDGTYPLQGTFNSKKGSALDYLGQFLFADLPNAADYAGSMVSITDETDGFTRAYSNGVNWLRVYDNAIATGATPVFDFTTDLVLYTKFDGNSNDDSGNGYNGSDTSMSYVAGQVGNCAQFGSGYIEFGDEDDFSFCDGSTDIPFTIRFGFFFNPGSGSTDEDMFGKRGLTTDREYFCRYDDLTGDIINFRLLSPTSSPNNYINVGLSTTGLTPNTWNHVVFTYDGSGTAAGLKGYLNDGIAVNGVMTGSYTKMTPSTSQLVMGCSSWDIPNGKYQGRIDDNAWYKNRVWTTDEIAEARARFVAGTSLIP